jgi:Flp pilus assembly protein protease CpaA
VGGALVGRDTWNYTVVAAIAGAVLLLIGLLKNRRYFSEMIGNRGALRRRSGPGAP